MIVQETVVHKMFDSDLRTLFGVRRKDTIKSVDVKADADGRPVFVAVTVTRPVRGRWFKKMAVTSK